jgi:hypothetical protein
MADADTGVIVDQTVRTGRSACASSPQILRNDGNGLISKRNVVVSDQLVVGSLLTTRSGRGEALARVRRKYQKRTDI